MGGANLYQFAPNATSWVDWLGLSITPTIQTGTLNNKTFTIATATLGPDDLGKGQTANQNNRNYVQDIGKCKDNERRCKDDAGHIIAKNLGGSNSNDNMFAQAISVNRGAFAQFEKQIFEHIKSNGNAVNITVIFDADITKERVNKIRYTYTDTVTGKTKTKEFENDRYKDC